MIAYIRSLALPLALVGLLAGILGFFVMRSVAGSSEANRAEVSVVGIQSTPSPSPSPSPSASPDGTGGTGRSPRSTRDPRCPSGCECQFPPGGTVVVCRGGGGTVRVP